MPSSLVMYHRLRGGHIHVRVFSGPREGHRTLNGVLVFAATEWAFFRDAVDASRVEFREEF